jgi:hypothetical protein
MQPVNRDLHGWLHECAAARQDLQRTGGGYFFL